MLSGGSRRSWSATSAASTVTVHVSAVAKSVPGSIANVVGPPVAVAAWPPLVPHTATPAAPLAGTVAVTEGAASLQFPAGDAALRGAGGAATKSAELLSVSRQPPPARNAAVVFESVGAGPAPSKKFAPS